jgi:hypothetical protein
MTLVTSPAGEPVEVVADDELGLSNRREATLGQTRYSLISALWTEGTIEDEKGLATGKLITAARAYGLATGAHTSAIISAQMRQPAVAQAIHRDTNGKRCYTIQLVKLAESWHEQLPGPVAIPAATLDKTSTYAPAQKQLDATPAPCPRPGCGTTMRFGSLRKHLIRHGLSKTAVRVELATVREQIRTGLPAVPAATPALRRNGHRNGHRHESVTALSPAELVAGILQASQHPTIPVTSLPAVHDLILHTGHVLEDL